MLPEGEMMPEGEGHEMYPEGEEGMYPEGEGIYPEGEMDPEEMIEIPEGMPVGHVIKLKGKGVSQGFMRSGDFLIVTHIDMPKKLSKKAKEMIEELRKEI